jgi:hypothetical protein
VFYWRLRILVRLKMPSLQSECAVNVCLRSTCNRLTKQCDRPFGRVMDEIRSRLNRR